MAIRINAGAAPKLGRISMPKGTYLPNQPKFSNPSTQADGGLGGGSGENPGTPPTLDFNWQSSFWNPKSLADFSHGIKGWWNSLPGSQPKQQTFYNALGQPVNYQQVNEFNGKKEVTLNPTVHDAQGNPYTWDSGKGQYVRNPTNALDTSKVTTSPANSLVGSDVGAYPNQLQMSTVQQILPGKNFSQIAEIMTAKGFQWNPQTQSFMKVGESAGVNQLQGLNGAAVSQEVGANGRPTWVDPTQLARNEGVTLSNGWTYVGGIPTKTGESQYAVTAPHRGMTAWEKKHGSRYKWVSTVQRDDSGNYVRVYSRQLRNIYTKHGMKTRAERRQNGGGGGNNGVGSAEINQLVTLRANYG